LIRALADPDADAVAEYVSEALVALGPHAVPRLIQALTDGHEPRGWLIRTLGNPHDPRACEPVAAILRDPARSCAILRDRATDDPCRVLRRECTAVFLTATCYNAAERRTHV